MAQTQSKGLTHSTPSDEHEANSTKEPHQFTPNENEYSFVSNDALAQKTQHQHTKAYTVSRS